MQLVIVLPYYEVSDTSLVNLSQNILNIENKKRSYKLGSLNILVFYGGSKCLFL
jgi:hypothetical protein